MLLLSEILNVLYSMNEWAKYVVLDLSEKKENGLVQGRRPVLCIWKDIYGKSTSNHARRKFVLPYTPA